MVIVVGPSRRWCPPIIGPSAAPGTSSPNASPRSCSFSVVINADTGAFVVEGVNWEKVKRIDLSTFTVAQTFDPANQINPLVSAKQQKRVLGMIETSAGQGAKIAAGGARHGEKGFFVKPTVIVDADASNIIVRDEVFGPVVVAIPFNDMDDAVAKANDTPYGLAASVWSQDVTKVFNFADAVKAGTVWANCHNLVDPNMPFGGYKDSGLGREHGRAGIENYLETKAICIAV